MLKIGCHVSMQKPNMLEGAVIKALNFRAETFMVYTGSPTNSKRCAIEELKIQKALNLMQKNNIEIQNIVGHAPYIINLCNPDSQKRLFAINFLTNEIVRFHNMQINQMVLHPGNAINKNKKESIQWIANGINQIFQNTSHIKTKIALETMAGKGNEIGSNFEELKDIINLIENKNRISICLDTCHIYDAGYDIKNNLDEVINLFDKIIKLKYLTCLHINDSKNILGSRKDRHANIGLGNIGFEAIIKIIYHPKFQALPKILETPFVQGIAPYKKEIQMIKQRLMF